MKRVFTAVVDVIIVALLLVGCGKTGGDAFVTGRFRAVEFQESFWSQEVIVVDTETNVLYLWVRSGNGGGLTPLLDGDGNVQLWDGR